ncbi:hypothetical protein PIB30_002326 [Stylosanthes scabra]|uniref:Uncharacterized protein n=1 Tax=Stylosanthes scabra TaxID=79078 RepID=A0ABU6U4H9_9FABA|nr:hypothetical protein [Stylosanthes scabra]
MVCVKKTWLLLFVSNVVGVLVNGQSQVPALFIFGDSQADDGNNNNLPTNAKANYKPYGIDFPFGIPTGRFTNGLTAIDIIGQLLGFVEFIPPFANTSGYDILKGVNYASGSAGIRIETGTQLGADISLGQQIKNHKIIVSKIAARLGSYENALEYLNKALYYVNIGSNDYLNNYFLPQYYLTSYVYTPQQYAQVLINQLTSYLLDLHNNVGARKVVLVGVGQIGCIPRELKNGSCAEDVNAAASLFSSKQKDLVDQFNSNFSGDGTKFIYVNTSAGSLLDPALGFTQFTTSCCPTREDGQCAEGGVPCSNRNEYLFYDEFHPTQAVNNLTAFETYNGTTPGFTYPMDVKTLAQS